MPAALKSSLDGSMTDSGELEQAAPPCLGKVPRDLLQNFPHTKRVGSYLVGKMINKGSFAKVMLGMHISTGEKVTGTHPVSYTQTPVNQRHSVTH
ncbi:hormonally up-regulated neu tumor-associated kinase homolog A-like [Megalobrama amblycephala]|uniref:hormonally up-regulated neu tumor-associated kinase homolog A-like n=1 Tax=Megalobrama amblycephala TaxID=75352 RepID=UPI0020141B6B|nr:hormonally up-regulated neu tumor-associated kinase homolog A-like [Megalobrama amblycephala]